MKKNTRKNFIVFALFVTLVTLIVVASTYAKYTSAVAGTGTATVAKWSFAVKDGEGNAFTNETEVTLEDGTVNGKVADDRIAPGTDGGLGVKLNAAGSEVAVDYIVSISDVAKKPTNLKFYSDAAFENELVFTEGVATITGSIALADVGTEVNVPIYWKWAYETTNGDETDTTEGIAADTMTFDITVTGTQADPTQA